MNGGGSLSYVSDLLIYAMGLPAWVFCILYALFARGRKVLVPKKLTDEERYTLDDRGMPATECKRVGAWWQHETGRHLMAFVGSFAVLLLLVASYRWWGDYPSRRELTIAGAVALAACLWWRVWLVVELLVIPTLRRRRDERTTQRR